MKDYKLYFELPADLMTVYKEHGLDIEDFNGEGRNGLPKPGAFVIDKNGIIRTMQAEVDYKTRMFPKDIILALAKLQGKFLSVLII
jgi:peroxiredoxin